MFNDVSGTLLRSFKISAPTLATSVSSGASPMNLAGVFVRYKLN